MFHPAVGTGYVKTEFCGDERSLSETAAEPRLRQKPEPRLLPVAQAAAAKLARRAAAAKLVKLVRRLEPI